MSAHSDFQTASDPKSSRVDVVVPMISDADSDSPLLNRHVEISMANAVGGDPLYFGRTRHDDFIFVNGIDNPPCGDLIKSSLSGTPDKRIEGKKKKKKGRRAHNHCSTAVRLDFADRIPSNHGSPAEYSEEFPVSRSPVCQGGQVPSASLVDLRVRYLCPGDIDEVKDLCNQIFPIEYPDYWFQDVVSNQNLFSLAATFNGKIVGLLVAEVKRLNQCNIEDRGILSKSFPANTPVTYLLSLGVLRPYRRHKIASYLVDHLLAYLTNGLGTPLGVVKAVYLHVLATNTDAMSFYEKLNFRQHRHLSGYYAINGQLRDGFSYVLYLNGGVPPLTVRDYAGFVVGCLKKPFCVLPRFACRLVTRLWGGCVLAIWNWNKVA